MMRAEETPLSHPCHHRRSLEYMYRHPYLPMIPEPIKHPLTTAEHSRGTWLSLDSPFAAEMAGLCDFDWLLLDSEHGLQTESSLQAALLALGRMRTAAVVRVPSFRDTAFIGKVLDWGADGVMVPQIRSVEEARLAIGAAHRPPLGSRGYSRSVRACGYGLNQGVSEPAVLLQIETVEAVQAVDEIAALPGADVLFIGPSDLRLTIETHASPGFDYDEAVGRIAAAAQRHGKKAGILLRANDEAPRYYAEGLRVLAFNSDTSILREGFLETLRVLSSCSG